MPNTEDRVHISLYVSPKLKKWLHIEAIRQDTWIQDIVEEYLWIAFKWAKKAEIVEHQHEGVDPAPAKAELKEIQSNLEDASTRKRKRVGYFTKKNKEDKNDNTGGSKAL